MVDLQRDLRWALDPVTFAVEALGMVPDAWQANVLRSPSKRMILCCSRQAGKSTVAAILAIHQAVFVPGSLTLVVSPSLRQSGELGRRISDGLDRLEAAPDREEDTRLTLKLANGSRIVCVPASETTIRGFSADLVIEDEAAYVPDSVYAAIRPMLAVSHGRLVLMSTPNGRRGHYHAEWSGAAEAWERVKITADEVPRISASFLADERRALGESRYLTEYFCSFAEREGAVFSHTSVMGAVSDHATPWTPGSCDGGDFILGVDLGQARDHTAIVLIERKEVEIEPRKLRKAFRSAHGGPAYADAVVSREYQIRYVERLPLSTSYVAIVARVKRVLADLGSRATLVVDGTGVGRAVVDFFEAAGLSPIAVTITAGTETVESGPARVRVPKRDLVASVQVLLEAQRLKIAKALPERTAIVDELLAFRTNISDAGHDSYGGTGEGVHDDLVISVALACWRGLLTEKEPACAPVAGVSEPYENEDEADEIWLGDPRDRYLFGRSGGRSRFISGGVGAITLSRGAPFRFR